MRSDLKEVSKKYKVDLPYPKIHVDEENKVYADLIKQNYAGAISELTATTQYTNYEINIVKDYPEINKTLRGIAEVEMQHLQILGQLVVELGGNSGFFINKKDKKLYWTSKFIPYADTVKDILIKSIDSEKEAIEQYRKTTSIIKDENIVAIINRIILDEEYHIKLLSELSMKNSII